MGHIVTAGYVTVETAVEGGRASIDITRGAMLPADVPDAQVQVLLDRGDVEQVDDPAPEPFEDTTVDPDAVPVGSAAAVLEWVDGDDDRAQRALDVEQAKGDSARKGLVADLTKLVEA